MAAAAGQPGGSFVLALATSRAGDYVIQPQINGTPLGQPLNLTVAPGPPELNRCVVVLKGPVGPFCLLAVLDAVFGGLVAPHAVHQQLQQAGMVLRGFHQLQRLGGCNKLTWRHLHRVVRALENVGHLIQMFAGCWPSGSLDALHDHDDGG